MEQTTRRHFVFALTTVAAAPALAYAQRQQVPETLPPTPATEDAVLAQITDEWTRILRSAQDRTLLPSELARRTAANARLMRAHLRGSGLNRRLQTTAARNRARIAEHLANGGLEHLERERVERLRRRGLDTTPFTRPQVSDEGLKTMLDQLAKDPDVVLKALDEMAGEFDRLAPRLARVEIQGGGILRSIQDDPCYVFRTQVEWWGMMTAATCGGAFLFPELAPVCQAMQFTLAVWSAGAAWYCW